MLTHEAEENCNFHKEVRDWFARNLDPSIQDLPGRSEPAQMLA